MSRNEQKNLSVDVLEKEILEMWRRALENESLTIDDDFFECGGDSLLAIELLLEIERLTGKALPQSIIFETGTVRQLSKKISETDKDQPPGVVLVGSEQGKIIHHFHGDLWYGGGVNFTTLYKMLGADYRIHVIPPQLPHEGELPDSIEEMAKDRLSKILNEQPNGPYVLLGTCIGALVGFETARLLISMGKEVKAVVMVDPVIMSVRRSAQFIFIAADFFMRFAGIQKPGRRKRLLKICRKLISIDERIKDFWRRLFFFFQQAEVYKRSAKEIPSNSAEKLRDLQRLRPEWQEKQNIKQHYFKILFNYKPLSLNVPLLYISLNFSGYAWRRITRDTVFVNIYRGRHVPWSEPYAPYLVDKIKEFISR